ncbi:MAG: hypothetical protein ABIH76_00440 [Candidatus Bathyarchaeota archaeon]
MPKYEKPIWQYVLEAAKNSKNVFSPIDIIKEIHGKTPEVPAVTIRSYVIGMAPNHPSSHHYQSTRNKHGYFEYLGGGKFRLAETRIQSTIPNSKTQQIISHREFQPPFSYINRGYDKVAEMKRRVDDVIDNFGTYIEIFNKENLFSGPSVYFHLKTLERGEKLGSVSEKVQDGMFLDYLYATLSSWGLHRMGDTGAKLVEYEDFKRSLQEKTQAFLSLEKYSLLKLTEEELEFVNGLLTEIIETISISASSTQLVSASKTIHHLLPELVPPIDRNYTVRFFYRKEGSKQVPLPYGGDGRIFKEIFPVFQYIAVKNEKEIMQTVGNGFHTSPTKVIDNAIVGYVLKNLQP